LSSVVSHQILNPNAIGNDRFLGQHGEPEGQFAPVPLVNRLVVQVDLTGPGRQQARKAFQQSTFTRTVGAQQAGNPTLGNGQRDVVHDRFGAIGKRELLGS